MLIGVSGPRGLKWLKGELERKVLEGGPVFVSVAKEMVPDFIAFLESRFFLYTPIADEGDSVVYAVSLPENYLTPDEQIAKYSAYLLDLEVLRELVRRGRLVESGVLESPRMVIRYLRWWALAGRKLILFLSTRAPVRGAVLLVDGKVRGAWADAVDVHVGMKAIRVLLYYGPYRYVVIELQLQKEKRERGPP